MNANTLRTLQAAETAGAIRGLAVVLRILDRLESAPELRPEAAPAVQAREPAKRKRSNGKTVKPSGPQSEIQQRAGYHPPRVRINTYCDPLPMDRRDRPPVYSQGWHKLRRELMAGGWEFGGGIVRRVNITEGVRS